MAAGDIVIAVQTFETKTLAEMKKAIEDWITANVKAETPVNLVANQMVYAENEYKTIMVYETLEPEA